MINVKENENGTFDIFWDENDPKESIMNNWTESDFINVITEHLNKLKQNDRETESTT